MDDEKEFTNEQAQAILQIIKSIDPKTLALAIEKYNTLILSQEVDAQKLIIEELEQKIRETERGIPATQDDKADDKEGD